MFATLHRPTADDVRSRYQALWSRLPADRNGDCMAVQTLGVTSCYRGEGVTTVAQQFAQAVAAQGERKVLLVDANLAAPSIHQVFHVPSAPGLVDAIETPEKLSEWVHPTTIEGLFVLPAGNGTPEGQVYQEAGFERLLASLQADFDLLVFDLPAAVQESPASQLASLLDGVLLVIEAERVRSAVAQRTRELLRRAHVTVVGAVLNKRRHYIPSWLYRLL